MHFIDKKWRLIHFLLAFRPVPFPHTGENIAKVFYEVLEEYGLLALFLMLVVDNASNNNAAIASFLRHLRHGNISVFFKGEFAHGRCLCHIMNLSARDGLDEIKLAIETLRDMVKAIRSSPKQQDLFLSLCSALDIPEGKAKPSMDVVTRWNSCLSMLDTSRPYDEAFIRYGTAQNMRAPSVDEWAGMDAIGSILRPYEENTLKFSLSDEVSVNEAFMRMRALQVHLDLSASGATASTEVMVKSMTSKLNKYIDVGESIMKAFAIGQILDPRFKLEYIKIYYPDEEQPYRDLLEQLFLDEYAAKAPSDSGDGAQEVPVSGLFASNFAQFKQSIKSSVDSASPLSELRRYLEEPCYQEAEGEEFDVLWWW